MPQIPEAQIDWAGLLPEFLQPGARAVGRTLSELARPYGYGVQGYGPEMVSLSDLVDIPESKLGVGLTLASMVPGGKAAKVLRAIKPQTLAEAEGVAAKLPAATILYHGGPEAITAVNPQRLQARDEGFFGKGFYTTEQLHQAQAFGPQITSATLSPDAKVLKASMYAHDQPELAQRVAAWQESMGHESFDPKSRRSWTNAVDQYAEAHGYDVVRYHPQQVVVKNPAVLSFKSRE